MVEQHPDPDVFFLPLAVADPVPFHDLDPFVLARRVPDFLHQVINQGEAGPTGMLEVQTPPDAGESVQWVDFDTAPAAADAFAMLPPGCDVRAVVTGEIAVRHEGFVVEMVVHFQEDLGESVAAKVQASVSVEDPVVALCKLARHLARLLGVPYEDPPSVLMTHNGLAFVRFLHGLDGSALLSGDLEIEVREDAEVLMQPYAQALALDPDFGLALRAAHITLFTALEESRIASGTCCKLIDGYLAAHPADGDACVDVAEHLAGLGESTRARAWLEHATHLQPPPAKGLENLGILCANSGDTIEARNLWLDGLTLNGHPDFLAHLARLAFAEEDLGDAWDKVLRGLRRIYERCVRIGEWSDDGHDLGLLLRYLVDHLQDHDAPDDVVEALFDLHGLLTVPEDHIDLGKCLMRLGFLDESRDEITAGLGGDLDPASRDDGIRVLLSLDVDNFEKRFARASDEMVVAADPSAALGEMDEFLQRQPEFWPALYLKATGARRLGREELALDCLYDVLAVCPGQPEALAEMAELFDARGNPKRAAECIEEAVYQRPEDAHLYAALARYLTALDRIDEAKAAAANALRIAPDDRDIRKLERRLRRR